MFADVMHMFSKVKVYIKYPWTIKRMAIFVHGQQLDVVLTEFGISVGVSRYKQQLNFNSVSDFTMKNGRWGHRRAQQ